MAAAIGIGGAVLLSLTDSGTAGMTAYAFNIGPGMEDHDIIYYQEQPENNPAYNNGWTSNVGPGASGSNPGGGLDSEKDYVYSKGPGNEAAQQYAKTENSTIYIHNTYRGGSWRQRADGKWALYKPDGNPVSSQWGYVDGKTYLLVAHNGISRVIESYFHDMTNEEFAKFGIKNCELKKYEWVE